MEESDESENDKHTDDDEHVEICDWCKKAIHPDREGQMIMVDEEDLCKSYFENSDLQRNSEEEWEYPKEQFEEYESSESQSENVSENESENEK